MDKDIIELDLKQENLNIEADVEIIEETESLERSLSKKDSFNNGDVSEEWQSFHIASEIMDDSGNEDPLEMFDYDGDEKLKNVGNFSRKWENAISDKEIKKIMPCTSGIKEEVKGETSDKSLLSNPSQAGKLEVSNIENKCSNKIKKKKQCIMHPEIKKLTCSQCSYETNLKGNLKKHSLIHSSTKSLKCSECNYETNRKDHLKLHLLNHSGAKLFKCSECNYETNRRDHLKVHLLNHFAAKLFKCSECNYETNRKDHHRVHVLNHSGVKLFKCSECSYETNRKHDLKVHSLNHGQ